MMVEPDPSDLAGLCGIDLVFFLRPGAVLLVSTMRLSRSCINIPFFVWGEAGLAVNVASSNVRHLKSFL